MHSTSFLRDAFPDRVTQSDAKISATSTSSVVTSAKQQAQVVTAVPSATSRPLGVCWDFLDTGICRWGDACYYKHVRSTSEPRPEGNGNSEANWRPQSVCYAFLRGQCEREKCYFRHQETEDPRYRRSPTGSDSRSRSPAQREYGRTSPARSCVTRFNNHNYNPEHFGAEHNYRPRGFQRFQPCHNFQKGHCAYGEQCAYSHDMKYARNERF